MSGAELAFVGAAVLVGAVVQGSIGFGLNLVAAPVLALVAPELMPGTAIAIGFVAALLLSVRERRDIDVPALGWAMVGRVPGTAAGAAAVALLSTRALSVAFAVLVLVAVALTVTGVRVVPTPRVLVGAGLVSGVMGTTSSIGGPPMAIALHAAGGATLRGTLSAYFLIGIPLSVAALAVVGAFGPTELRAAGVLLPPLLAGLALSRLVAGRLNPARTSQAVLAVSTLAAVAVLLRALSGQIS